jgi:hypothetical protein
LVDEKGRRGEGLCEDQIGGWLQDPGAVFGNEGEDLRAKKGLEIEGLTILTQG